jgi:hypothetical protein
MLSGVSASGGLTPRPISPGSGSSRRWIISLAPAQRGLGRASLGQGADQAHLSTAASGR